MADQAPVIIIRKKKKGGHGGHHGGAWKVAYADFVTAMMSFFLLMWLLNVTTAIQRKGIADYFSPASISKSESGAGGIFGGLSIDSKQGAQMSDSSQPSVQQATVPTVGKGEEGDTEAVGDSQGSDGKAAIGKEKDAANNQGENTDGVTTVVKDQDPLTADAQAMAAAMKNEEETFKSAEETLKQAILESAELQAFANQILIDRTPEGLRIQIVDRDKFSLFPSGGAIPYQRGVDLLTIIGKVISRLPNKISVTGHTDSTPFTAGSRRDNWTLSTERANISREYLVKGGVDDGHIARVSGLSDRDPFIPGDAADPRNRRISIVLLRKALPPSNLTPNTAAPTAQ